MKYKKYSFLWFFIVKSLLVFTIIYSVYYLSNWYFQEYTSISPLRKPVNALYFEPLALLLTFFCLFLVTARMLLSLLLVSIVYVLFLSINAEMVERLGLIFSPIDIKHSFQLLLAKEFLLSYWKSIVFTLVTIALLIFGFIKSTPNVVIKKKRPIILLSLFSVFILLGANRFYISQKFPKHFNMKGQSIPQIFAENHGFLFSFYYNILKKRPTQPPKNYTEQAIDDLTRKYTGEVSTESGLTVKPHVIIFFIEAFADPWQMGIKTSHDPIPNFRKYAAESTSGLVISPEMGGRSANPEFELLTGLSMRFVPEKSIPYIDYINKPYPSLAWEFKKQGYQTSAIHVASLLFFNYKKAYQYLGFDRVDTLHKRAGVEMDPANRFPSENSLVDEIIQTIEKSKKPQFIFSFPNSTHGFWDYNAYLKSDLNVYGDFLDGGKSHLKTYINAINKADLALGRIFNHFEESGEPVVIIALGDHQPSLPEFRQKKALELLSLKHPEFKATGRKKLKKMIQNTILKSDENFYKMNHQVPYLIWNNYDVTKESKNTSMNFLSSILLNKLKINTTPFYNFTKHLSSKVSELSVNTKVNIQDEAIVEEYKLFQYDIMSGQDFYSNKSNEFKHKLHEADHGAELVDQWFNTEL